MRIQFSDDREGFNEAMCMRRIVERLHENHVAGGDEVQIIESISAACDAHIANAEGGEKQASLPRKSTVITPSDSESGAGLWRNLFGPSRRETRLSEQRVAALERAMRAERASFEALAETAYVARERDAVLVQIKDLHAQIARLSA